MVAVAARRRFQDTDWLLGQLGGPRNWHTGFGTNAGAQIVNRRRPLLLLIQLHLLSINLHLQLGSGIARRIQKSELGVLAKIAAGRTFTAADELSGRLVDDNAMRAIAIDD